MYQPQRRRKLGYLASIVAGTYNSTVLDIKTKQNLKIDKPQRMKFQS